MAGFGEALRRERELREIGLREIANATKINLRYLEALEQGRFDILPGGVFNKGFIRAYARFIGADGEALVDRYMLEIAERDAVAQGSHPTPDRPGLLRPQEAPRRRAGGSAGVPAPAGSPAAASAVHPAITLVENSRPAAAAYPAPAPGPAPSAVEAEANRSRLLLALATVVAALVAVGVVFALLRAARRDAELPAHDDPAGNQAAPPAQDSGSAPAPETAVTPAPGADAPAPIVPAPEAANPAPRKPEHRDAAPPRPKTDDATEGARIASPLAPPPQAPRPVEPLPPPSPAVTSGPMTVRIAAQAPVAVQVSCDGEDRINRTFQANESEVLRCFSVVRVSATDAGALALSIDGAPCAALGPAGGRVEHFTIRPDTARAICPAPASGEDHGRR
jgi:hypothetical protein